MRFYLKGNTTGFHLQTYNQWFHLILEWQTNIGSERVSGVLWMLRRPEKITFAWVNDVVILEAKIPFTGRSKYPNPRIKIFPGDACRLSQWNVAAPVLHLPLHTVVCMKDTPFDLISSDLLNFLDNKDNTTWKYSTFLHISKMLFLIYCFFL